MFPRRPKLQTRSTSRTRRRLRTQLFEVLEPRWMMNSDWRNPSRPLDVNNDMSVSPLDALVVINAINGRGAWSSLGVRSPLNHYLDTNGDNSLSPLDALTVINGINDSSRSNELSNQRIDGEAEPGPAGFISIVMGNLPGDRTQLVGLTTQMTLGREEFNEMGLFVVDSSNGSVNGVMPSAPEYASTVFASAQRQVLFSKRDTFRTARNTVFPAGSTLGVYVLQESSDNSDPTKHLRVRDTGTSKVRIGWEEHVSALPWIGVGDRGYDDAMVDVQFGTPYDGNAEPVITAIPNQSIVEQTELLIQTIAMDADMPNESLVYSLDIAPNGATINPTTGQFRWTPTEAQGPGNFEVLIRATDRLGAFDTESFTVTVLESNRAPVLQPIANRQSSPGQSLSFSASASDLDLPGNSLTYSLQTGSPVGATINAATGAFAWNIPAGTADGDYAITVRVTDSGSPALFDVKTFTVSVSSACPFDASLSGWKVIQSGEAASTKGTVTSQACSATMREGSSFVVGLERDVVIPATPSAIEIGYQDLSFDATSTGFVRDAFEVALVDTDGNSLVQNYVPGRDAFFNVTEGLSPAFRSGVTFADGKITIGLGGIPAATPGKLIVRMLNNDSDTQSSVRLSGYRVIASSIFAGAPEGLAQALRLATTTRANRNVSSTVDYLPPAGPVVVNAGTKLAVENKNSSDAFQANVEWVRESFSVLPSSTNVMMTPAVIDLDLDGNPEVIFSTSSGNSPTSGVLRAIRGNNGEEFWSASAAELALQPIGGIAAANLDLDLNPEIVAISPSNSLIAFNHDGSLLWRSSVTLEPRAGTYLLSTPSIADLDGDGQPEIIVGAKVFDNQGELLWDRHGETGLSTGTILTVGVYGAISAIADLDRDGKQEVIAGSTAYRHNGALFWDTQLPDGTTAIGNFDDDLDPEIVLVSEGMVYLLDSNGRTVWGPIAIPGGGVGGAPTIADIDGDSLPEITVAGASQYVAIEHNGIIKWQTTVQDQSSNVTGSTVFDLDGDGDAEVIYGDEKKLRVYDGSSGEVLYEVDKSSNTALEMPIVVDVDADGVAEIVVVANTVAGHGPQKGIFVIGNDDAWVGTRKIWNQNSYHITNVNDDGSIPRVEANGWEVYNNYRRNQQPTGTQFGVPMITASAANSRFTPGTNVLISGNAVAQGKRSDGTPNAIDLVTINGDAPDQIDAGGAYLSLVAIRAGRNDFEIVATDAVGQRTSGTLTLWGVNPPESGIDFSTFTDTTSTFTSVYGRTSFDENNELLFVDLATRNTGAFETQTPLLVGVKNINDPSVSVVGFDGFMPDGTPYFDYSDQVATGRLMPNENSRAPSIAFVNPNQIQFTYELVFLSQVNQPPAIQTLPKIEAFPGKGYSYDVNAIDPDADTLTYSLVSSPTGMAINATTGVITWQPSTSNLGTVPVSVQVSDERGGSAVQDYVISVTPALPSRPPVITSRPITNTNVSKIVETPTTNVDVSSWSILTFQGTEGGLGNVPTTSPDWRIAPDGRSVKQLVNASASIFLSDFSFANQRTSGVWKVEDTGTNGLIDDDFIGFVFGYQDPQHFYLFDWKQRNQTSDSAVGKRGMNVRRIDADSPLNKMDLWNSDSVPGRTTSLYRNDIAWKNQTEYTFDLEFANGFIEIIVKEGETILDSISIEDDRYASGGFGFYNYSQGEVVYKGFVKRDVSANAYRYDVDAVDADGDSVMYRLANGAPDGMAINRTNGLIEWSPTPLQVGDHQIVVEVIDGLGGIATQNFTICVHPDPENNPPIIISDPNSSNAQLLNPSFGDVSPQLITIPNDSNEKLDETVSLRLPPTTIASKVDVFLLFDDTGSFTSASQILKDQFRDVIANLQQSMPNVDFAFGIGRFEDYNHPIANPNPVDRPFILNQPIISVATPGFSAAIDSALSRTTPGCETSAGRCDLPESMLEGLYQVATGQGFDGDNDGNLLESGPAGLLSTQLNPGDSGDVPPFESFQADPANHVLPAAGTRGGVGFRRDALPVILVATDDGTAYQPAGSSPITGVNGVQVPLSTLTRRGRPSTPYGNGANFQSTISALNELGAVVIGLGTNSNPNSAPRSVLEGISVLTGAVNQSTSDIASGIPNDPIETGSPLYFQIALGTPGSVATGIQTAINASVSDVAISIDVVLANASTGFQNKTGVIANARSGDLVSFEVEIEPGAVLRNTDILFVRSGTTTILGSIPLSAGKGFEYTVVALDPDGDSIRYTLDQSPSGLLIDERSGVVSWQFPTQLPQLATVTASDGKGGKSSQTFRIEKSTGLPPDAGTQSSLAVLNRSFVYDMRVGRPDGQSNSYSLSAAPAGMTIHPQLGIIAWSPTKDQLGSHSVVVRIASASGSLSSEMLRITVSEPNVVPYITSIPQTRANVARSYLSNLVAQDADGDLLEFTLVSGPAGMSIQRNAIRNVEGAITDYSHSLTWTPATTQVGNQVVKLSVKDGRGGTDTQEFTISTSADPFSTNTPPSILSRPRVTTSIGSPYAYLPTARELDGDPLSWSLTAKPDGMSIDTVTGLITWSPTAQQLGNQRVVLAVSDGLGGIATQDFTIAVSNVLLNSPPIITSNPRTVATEGNEYQYNVVAEDSDYDLIRYTLEFAPRGMSIDSLRGTIRWQPDEEQLGEYQVIVRAADPMGGSTTQQFSIDVRCGNLAPAIISIPPTRAVAQRTYLYAVRADDFEQDSLSYRLIDAPAGMTINSTTGVIRWQPTLQQIRSFDVTVEAVDPLGAIGKQSYKVVVQSATDPVDPTNPNGPKVGNRPPLITSTPDFTAASDRSTSILSSQPIWMAMQ